MEVYALQKMALTSAAISLFHQTQPMENLHDLLNQNKYKHRPKFTALEKEIYLETAEKEIDARVIPPPIKTKLKCTIIPISQEILDWTLFFHNTFSYKNSSLIKEFCWIPNGRIDGEKTVKKLINKENDILLKFKMAAYFCLKEEILKLIKLNKEFLENNLENSPNFKECLYPTSIMLSIWSEILFNKSGNEKKIFKNYFSETFKRFSCAAVIYFYNINQFSSRENEVKFISDCLENLKSFKKTERNFPKSHETNVAFYLIEKLTEEEFENILSEYHYMTEFILSLCTEYSFRDKFFNYKKILSKFINDGCFLDNNYYSNSTPLLDVFKKIPQDPEFYKKIFCIILKSINDKIEELEIRSKSKLEPNCEIENNLEILLDLKNNVAALLFSQYHDDLIVIMSSFNVETKEWFVSRQIEREPFAGFVKRFTSDYDRFERMKFVGSVVECLEKRKVLGNCENFFEVEGKVQEFSRLMVDYILENKE